MDIHNLLSAAVVLLAATAVTIALFSRLGLGSVVGFLAAGIVVGPWGFNVTDQVEALRHFAEIGVVLLLFIIGLEMQPEKLWSMRRLVFGLGTLQLVVTGAVLGGYMMLFGMRFEVALIVGLGLALSSTAFVMQILSERGEFATEPGRAAFAVLLLQDIAIVPLLALVPLLAHAMPEPDADPFWLRLAETVGVLAAVYVFGRWVVPLVLRWSAAAGNREAFSVGVLLAVLGAAWAMDIAGLSLALGAFFIGMLLSGSEYRYGIEAVVEPFKGFLIGLFFISVGMSIDVGVIMADGLTALGHVVAVLVLKAAVLFGLGLAFGLGRETAVRVALLLPQCGEFGFVLFGAALAAGLLTDQTFNYLVLIISVSMVATPSLVKLSDWAAKRLAQKPEGPVDWIEQPGRQRDRHVVVAGYGRVGRTVCLMMERSGIPYVAFDSDPRRVALGKREHHAVHYGDVAQVEVLDAAGVGRAAAIVVTVNDAVAAERLVAAIRNFYPDVLIQARANNLRSRDELLAHGVSVAIPDAEEAALQLGQVTLEQLGLPSADIEAHLHDLRQDGYARIRPSRAVVERRRRRKAYQRSP